jgi:hypothetical protein
VFRQLIEYIHTGCVTLQARTLLGNWVDFCFYNYVMAIKQTLFYSISLKINN